MIKKGGIKINSNKNKENNDKNSSNSYSDEEMNKAFEDFSNIDYKCFTSLLFTLNPYEYATIAYILGVLISTKLTNSEQDSFGNWLMLMGQVMVVISSQTKLLQPDAVKQDEFKQFKQKLQQQLNMIMNKNKSS